MAVVQISKIQIRRGLKNSGVGVPQLSSAEFAWAVDTQELFIGNGSIAEGAPYVGNTKILTENDNILNLASSYLFASDDNSITLSVPRSLSAKLDEYVSVADFGAVGDGVTDNVSAFETAFAQLFKNTNSNYKKVLLVPNGTYYFASSLKIPSDVIIRGETVRNTVLNINSNSILFTTSTGLEVADFDSSNRPQNINISNLTIQRTTGQLVLTGVANSNIDNVRFLSNYTLLTPVPSLASSTASVFWENTLPGTRVTGITFNKCSFESTAVGVKCDQRVIDSTQPPIFRTEVIFNECKFFVCNTGIYIATDALLLSQGNDWKINDCVFEEIAARAIETTGPGRGTLVQRSSFKNCGNVDGTAGYPDTEIIYFDDMFGNVVKDCSINRHQQSAIVNSDLVPAKAEVANGAQVTIIDRNVATIFPSDSPKAMAVFATRNRYMVIDYTLTLGDNVRYGQLTITTNDNATAASLTDSYQYTPNLIATTGGDIMTNFEFSVALKDNDTDTTVETLVLYYKNPLPGSAGTMSYSVAYGV